MVNKWHWTWLIVWGCSSGLSGAAAQQAQEAPPATAGENAPEARQDQADAEQRQPLTAKVVEVVGDVRRAPTGTSPLDADAWLPTSAGDELPGGTLLRTGIRSSCILLFGDDTVIDVKRMSLASISDVYKTETEKTVRLGLGYGAIRGGSTEGTLRSNLIIDSTVATLAKRGTKGFEMQVEPYTGRFSISLAREGLLEALQKRTGQVRLVRPGEYANEVNIAKMWIKQDQFDRRVRFVPNESISTADLDFTTANPRGMGTIAPGGTEVVSLSPRATREFITDQVLSEIDRTGDRTPFGGLDFVIIDQPIVRRPEGNFGVGNTVRVLLPDRQRTGSAPRLLPRRVTQRAVDEWARTTFRQGR